MKKYILLVSFALLIPGMSHAEGDPMKSLFVFQQTMANQGNTTAMMKLGEMYEQGLGTKQDFAKAIEMYRKAKAGGHAGADAAIARVMRTRQAHADAARQNKTPSADDKQREQARQRAEAERQAEQERQAQLERQAQQERQAREKARQQALARKRAEQARRDAKARAQAQAQAEQAARAKAAATEAARRAQQQALLQKQRAQAKQQQAAAPQKTDNNNKKDESFKSDPCKGPAARVMSICK
jgi:membrane protein involved in colicin uptake